MSDYTGYIAASYGIAAAVMIWIAASSILRWKKTGKK